MKFSEQWLREWVDPAIDTATLIEQLTMAGLEVDAREPVAGPFTGVVVARVESVEKHPNAEKLSLCQVHDGEAQHQVICGAPNVRPGLVTAFARIGAVLPGEFKIKKAKLRQVESFGMLCSASELGVGDDADGIMELPDSLQPGDDLRVALALDDESIEVDLTPNRGDCLSLRGLAREVGVLNLASVTTVDAPPVAATHDDVVGVQLEDPAACPRYLGRVIRGVDVTRPTPWWLAERLRRCGLRSIDPVVDVTNYVMLVAFVAMVVTSTLTHGIELFKQADVERIGRQVIQEKLDLTVKFQETLLGISSHQEEIAETTPKIRRQRDLEHWMHNTYVAPKFKGFDTQLFIYPFEEKPDTILLDGVERTMVIKEMIDENLE